MSKYKMETAVERFLDDLDLRYTYEVSLHTYVIRTPLPGAMSDGLMTFSLPRADELCCITALRRPVPSFARGRVAEYLNEANGSLFMGIFQLDMSDGQLVLQIGSCHADEIVTERELARIMEMAVDAFEAHAGNILRLIGSCESLSDAEELDEELERLFSMEGLDDDDEDDLSDIFGDEENEYAGLLRQMDSRQLEQLSDAVFTEMGRRSGIDRKLGEFPAEYGELAAGLTRMELMELSLALLSENFRRHEPDDQQEETSTAMSDEELSRRKASSTLKETMISRMMSAGD